MSDDESSGPSLKSLVQDLRERLFSLRTHDRTAEIHAYCDDLQGHLDLSFESVFKHLQELQESMLDEIQTYRNKLLSSHSTARLLSEDEQEADHSSGSWENLQQEISEISAHVDHFDKKYSLLVGQDLDASKRTEIMREAADQAEVYKQSLRQLRKELRVQTFRGQFLKLRAPVWPYQPKELVGTFETTTSEDDAPENQAQVRISERPFATLESHAGHILVAKFLSNGCLITASYDKTVRLCTHALEQGKVIAEGLYGAIVVEIVELPNGCLASGSSDGSITLWNKNYQPVKRILAHDGNVFSLLVLPNGHLASLSVDQTVKVWVQQPEDEMTLLFTMEGSCCLTSYCRLKLLPDGLLATCSDSSINGILRIWNPYKGTLVKQITTNLKDIFTFTVFENNDVVLSTKNGSLHLLNLYDESRRKDLIPPKADRIYLFVRELANGRVLISDSLKNNSLEIWDVEKGQIVQSFKSGHPAEIFTCDISLDGKKMVTGAKKGSVKLWNLD